MYSNGSEACLHNSKELLQSAKLLFDRSSYGPAQSLAIVSMEEAGKAVILELANLGRVTNEVVELAMTGHLAHSLKKIVVVGIQQSRFLLDKELVGEAEFIIKDKESIKKLQKDIKVSDLEAKRQNGLYINIDNENGNITNNPANLNPKDALLTIKQALIYLGLCSALCRIFRDLRKRPSLSSVKIRRVEVPTTQQLESDSYEDSNQTFTIVLDEI